MVPLSLKGDTLRISVISAIILTILSFYTVHAHAQGLSPSSKIHMLRYGCHDEFPLPKEKLRGSWVALSYPMRFVDEVAILSVNGKGTAYLGQVKVNIVPCGKEEHGENPDSLRTQIPGRYDRNVQWLFRGLRPIKPLGSEIECGKWLITSPRAKGNTKQKMFAVQKLSGIFGNKKFTIDLSPSYGPNGVNLEFAWDGKRQVLMEPSMDCFGSIFVGDIDGDGRPDIILAAETDKGCRTDTLYLSSRAKTKQLVKKSASTSECS